MRSVLIDEGLLDVDDDDAFHSSASAASREFKHADFELGTHHIASTTIDWPTVLATVTHPHVPLLALAGFFNGATLSGLAYFLPTIVSSLLSSSSPHSPPTANHVQLMSAPPFAAAFALSMLVAYLADRYHKHGGRELAVVFCAVLVVAGFAVFLGDHTPAVRYGSLFLLVPGTYTAAPPLATLLATYPYSPSSSHASSFASANANAHTNQTHRATALALLCIATNAGGVLSTWLLGWVSKGPEYTAAGWVFVAFGVGMGMCAGGVGVVRVMMRERR